MMDLPYPDSSNEIDLGVLHYCLNASEKIADCEYAAAHFVTTGSVSATTSIGDSYLRAVLHTGSLLSGNPSNSMTPRIISGEQEINAVLRPHAFNGALNLKFLALFPFGDRDGNILGMLCLGSSQPREKLNAAQLYSIRWMLSGVLRTPSKHAAPGKPRHHEYFSSEAWRAFEAAISNSDDSILITEVDLEGPLAMRTVYCNAAFTKLTGYAKAEIINKTPCILQGPATSRMAIDRLEAALQAATPSEIELVHYRKDGSPFWADLNISPVADERGHVTHWVFIQRDATTRKALRESAINEKAAIAQEASLLHSSIADLRKAHDALLHSATHDDLTGLRNRAYLLQCLHAAVSVSPSPHRRIGALLYLDLDDFKGVNDRLGHAAGDTLLREVSQRLTSCLRASDVLARIAGDEFVMLVADAEDVSFLEKLAQRIQTRLAAPLPAQFSPFRLSGSLGAVFISTDYNNAEDVLQDADAAMYAAKRSGKGRFVIFQNEMREHMMNTLELRNDLLAAQTNNNFKVHYQPIFHIGTRSIVGVEALLRWTHPVRGDIPPSEFIPLAEKIGLISDIDRWVRNQCFFQFSEWRRRYPGLLLRLNINVSAMELRDKDFVSQLVNISEKYNFPLRNLEIEITEGVLLDESPRTMEILKTLRERGICVALDDFGTGYSSLAYIANYEIDSIKIDKSFVTKMLGDRKTMVVLESISFLARRLNLNIVAEGIETEEQLSALQNLGCSFAQGYHLGRPLDGVASTHLLDRLLT
jgi:diguanylate cyclase (GGDEF)-like protein/PAS domain S-box-containing protein